MASLIHATGHGLVAGDTFRFANFLPTDCGVDANTAYYVLAAGLTANTFEFSTTLGGTPFVLTSPMTDGSVVGLEVYSVDSGVMAPPTAPTAPGSCVLTSDAQLQPDGSVITRLIVTITQPTSATLRNTIVTVIGGANTVGTKVVIPVGLTEGSIASVIPGVSYVGTAISYDTFGLASSPTVSAAHVAAGDVTAPAQVTSLAAVGAIRGALVSWAGSAATDLSHYELQIDSSNTFGTATTYKVKVSVASIVQLAVGTWFFRVRAVDLTGNAGSYSSTVSAVSRLVAGNAADIAANSITANDVLAGSITADRLTIGARQTGSSGNQVLNGSFEDLVGAVPASWTLDYDATGSAASYGTDAVNFNHGARSHFIAAAGTTSGSAMASKSWPVTPGEVFYISVWVLGGTASADGLYLRSFYGTVEDFGRNDAGGVLFDDLVNDGALTTSWVHYQGYTTVPAGKTWMRFALYNWQPATTTTVRYDNVVCERVGGGIANSTGTVVIDASGITITGGKLSFVDTYGSTAMDGGGFGTEWVAFIRSGIYNNSFTKGLTTDIPVSETGSGTPLANYVASLTSNLPYWVVAASGGELKQIADATASGGKALNSAATVASQTNRWYQDIPVISGKKYLARLNEKWVVAAGDFALNHYYSWRDSTHALIGSRVGSGLTVASTRAAYALDTDTQIPAAIGAAPANAVFLRYETEIVHNNSNTTYQLSDISLIEANADRAFRGAAAWRSTTQTLTTGIDTAISFDTEYTDTENMFTATSTNITIKIAGFWRLTGRMGFTGAAGGTRRVISVRVNGSTPAAPDGEYTIVTGGNAFDLHGGVTIELNLAVGDVITLVGNQNSGGNLTVKLGAMLMCEFIGFDGGG